MYILQTLKNFTNANFIDQVIINNYLYQIPGSSSYGKIFEMNLDTNEYNEYQISNHSYNSLVYVEEIQSLFLIPSTSTNICEFNLISKQITYYPISQNGFSSGVYHNGKIIMVPITGNVIGIFDIYTKSFTTTGNYSSISGFKWGKQIKVENFLYAPPLNQSYILKINLDTLQVTNIGSLSGSNKWCQQQYFPKNNRIYFIPQQSTQFLELNPENDTFQLFGSITISQSFGYGGGYGIIDDLLYILPVSMNNIIVLHPYDKSFTFIPLSSIAVSSDNFIYSSNNLTYNNKLYLIPRNTKDIYQCDFTFDNKINSENNFTLDNYQENFTIPINFIVQDTSDIFIPLNTSWIHGSTIEKNKISVNLNQGISRRQVNNTNIQIGFIKIKRPHLTYELSSKSKIHRYVTKLTINRIHGNNQYFYSSKFDFSSIGSKTNFYSINVQFSRIFSNTNDYSVKLLIDKNITVSRLRLNYIYNIGYSHKYSINTLLSNLRYLKTLSSVYIQLIEFINSILQSTIGVYFGSSSFSPIRTKISELISNQKNIDQLLSNTISPIHESNQLPVINSNISVFSIHNLNQNHEVSTSFTNIITHDLQIVKINYNSINLKYNLLANVYKQLTQINEIGILSDKHNILLQQVIDNQTMIVSYINYLVTLIKNSILTLNTNYDTGNSTHLEKSVEINPGLSTLSQMLGLVNTSQFKNNQMNSIINSMLFNTDYLQNVISVGTGKRKKINLLETNVSYKQYISSIFLDSYIQKFLKTSLKFDLCNKIYKNINILDTIGNLQLIYLSTLINTGVSYISMLQFNLQIIFLRIMYNKISVLLNVINDDVKKITSLLLNVGNDKKTVFGSTIENVLHNLNNLSMFDSIIKDIIITPFLNIESGNKVLNSISTNSPIALNKNINFNTIKLTLQDEINNKISSVLNLIENIKDYLFTRISIINYEQSVEKLMTLLNVDYVIKTIESMLQIVDVSQDIVKRFILSIFNSTGFRYLLNPSNFMELSKKYLYYLVSSILINEIVNLVSGISIYINYRKIISRNLSITYYIQQPISNVYQINVSSIFNNYRYLSVYNNLSNSLKILQGSNINVGVKYDYSEIFEIQNGFIQHLNLSLIVPLELRKLSLYSFSYIYGSMFRNTYNSSIQIGHEFLNINSVLLKTLLKNYKQLNNLVQVGVEHNYNYSNITDFGINKQYVLSNSFNTIKTLSSIINDIISVGYFTLNIIQPNLILGKVNSNLINLLSTIGYLINLYNSNNITTGIYLNSLSINDLEIQKFLNVLYSNINNIGSSDYKISNINEIVGYTNNIYQSSDIILNKQIVKLLNLFTLNDFLLLVIKKLGVNIEQVNKQKQPLSTVLNNVFYNNNFVNQLVSNLKYTTSNLQIVTELQYSIIKTFINSNIQVSFNKDMNYSLIKLQFSELEISNYSILNNLGISTKQINSILYSLLRDNKITLSNIISMMYYKLLHLTSILEIIQHVQKDISQITNIQIDEYIYPSIKILFDENIMEIIKHTYDNNLVPPLPYVYSFDEENPYDESYFSKNK